MKLRILFSIIPLFIILFGTTSECPKIGLVLSGGAARGFAHIGTLKMLDSLNIKVDYIVGTSMGAVAGALYAIGKTGKEIEKMAFDLNWNELLTDTPIRQNLPHFQKKDTGKYQIEFGINGLKPVAPLGYIHGQKILLELSNLFGQHELIHSFDDLKIPFRCIASDIVTGNEVVFSDGSLTEAVRASITIPTIFSPVIYGDSLLVDGGLINNLPVDIAIQMGADIILAVDTGTPKKNRKQLKNAMDILEQVISIHIFDREAKNSKLADFVIKPDLEGFRAVNFNENKLKSINNRGHKAALENIELFKKIKSINKCNIFKENIKKDYLNESNSIKIGSIEIIGNKKFKDGFLKQNLGISIGNKLDTETLQTNIMQLYSLGYFSTVYYTIEPINKNKVGLKIKVQENLSNKIRLGVRWDKTLDLITVIDLQLTDLFISGLRLEHQFQFVGLRKNIFNLFYPSRTLDFPIYPFLRLYDLQSIFGKYSINGTKKGIYSYQSQMIGSGIGFQLKNKWFIELEYDVEVVNVESEFQFPDLEVLQDNVLFKKIFISSKLDLIDNILIPKSGNLVSIHYELSNTKIGSNLNYSWIEILFDMYYTIKDNTFRIKNIYTDYNNVSLPNLFHYTDQTDRAIGYYDEELFGNNLLINQLEYRYEHKKDIYFKFILNNVMKDKKQSFQNYNNSFNYGLGITLISPLGPMNFIWSWSDNNLYESHPKEYHFDFTAGFIF